MERVDVLVLGGGVAGVCTAREVLRRGRQVTILDRGQICSGSSYGNAGLIVPSHSVPIAEPGVMAKGLKWLFNPESPFYIKWRSDRQLLSWLWHFRRACTHARVERAMPLMRDLHLESLRLFGALSEEVDFEFGARGRLLVCREERGLESVAREAELMRGLGLEVDMLTAAELAEKVGNAVQFSSVGAAYYPQDAHVQPQHFVRQLAAQCAELGARVVEECEVLAIEGAGGRVSRVRTTRGDWSAEQVVLAGGAWSPQLLSGLAMRLPVQPAKGYSIMAERPERCPDIPFMLTEAKVAVTPLRNEVRFTGTLELAGLDLSINQRRVDAMRRAVATYVPDWTPDRLRVREIWRGLRPCSPDGLPFLGRSAQWANLVVATGHGMCGLSLGPVTGQIAGQLVCGEASRFDLALCRVERFA